MPDDASFSKYFCWLDFPSPEDELEELLEEPLFDEEPDEDELPPPPEWELPLEVEFIFESSALAH